MNRRKFVALAGSAAAFAARPTLAQVRIYRIGFLGPSTGPVPEHRAFFDALATLGYREGQNLAVERRFSGGDEATLPAFATDLVRLGVEVIVVQSTTAAQAAKRATTRIPIVMGSVADALTTGLVTSFSHPGGNITGLSFLGRDWTMKHVELLLELKPGLTRLAFLANFSFLPEPPMYRDMQAAAASRNVDIQLFDVRHVEQIEPAFQAMKSARIEAVAVAPNVFFRERREQIVALMSAHELLAIYGSRDFVEVGGLVSYGIDFYDLWRRAAGYVNQILKGSKPGDLPIEQPSKFDFTINIKAAKALGIAVPPAILARADEVME